MDGNQKLKVTTDEVRAMLEALRASIEQDECWTCDCMQGFLTQLELDAEQGAKEMLMPLKVSRSQMHG
jgi:hypothetical protein